MLLHFHARGMCRAGLMKCHCARAGTPRGWDVALWAETERQCLLSAIALARRRSFGSSSQQPPPPASTTTNGAQPASDITHSIILYYCCRFERERDHPRHRRVNGEGVLSFCERMLAKDPNAVSKKDATARLCKTTHEIYTAR